MFVNLNSFFHAAPIEEGLVTKISNWNGFVVKWIRVKLQDRDTAFFSLVIADLIFINVAYRIGVKVYKYFPSSELQSKTEKIVKDVVVSTIFLSSYGFLHYHFIAATNLRLNSQIANTIGVVILFVGSYFKYNKNIARTVNA
ncbi:MAG: hypothetical protein H0W88_05285 [Parachlamydiaceae bacterium]|nr:hypothetical protein [Parachlamydiaceae bacterium]